MGVVVRARVSHQYDPGLIPCHGIICGLILLLVLVLAPAGGFFSGFSNSPTPTKPTVLNSNLIGNLRATGF